jgi:hypothetical protein
MIAMAEAREAKARAMTEDAQKKRSEIKAELEQLGAVMRDIVKQAG